jgi:hypothetical protein
MQAHVYVPDGAGSSPREGAQHVVTLRPAPRELVWVGTGIAPGRDAYEHAVQVLSAVPLAGAVGWSVHGHPWSCHPRPLRTAVVQPSGEWSMAALRGVREVDLLSGVALVRRSHLERLDVSLDAVMDSPEGTTRMSRAMRRHGFRLLYLGPAER